MLHIWQLVYFERSKDTLLQGLNIHFEDFPFGFVFCKTCFRSLLIKEAGNNFKHFFNSL